MGSTDRAKYKQLFPDGIPPSGYKSRRILPEGAAEPTLYIDSSYNTSAGIQVMPGAYIAVVMAAFGGVRAKVSNNKTMNMHPMVVFLLVVPLFVVQMTTIFALRLDLDVRKGVMDASILESETKAESMTALKCLMVLVVQLTSFGVMLDNMRLFLFVLNPITWFEIDHPHPEEWLGEVERNAESTERMIKKDASLEWKLTWLKSFFHPIFLAIPCGLSLACRLGVSYLVCVDSMSIIFASSTMTEAIFNALVLTFIFELNEIYWKFLSVILNLDRVDEFQFTVRAEAMCAIEDIVTHPEKSFKEALANDQDIKFPAITGNLIKYAPFLSRSRGWRRISNSLAFFALFLIYLQQLFVVIFALATNVLPVARDMCTMWRWSNGEARWLKKLAPFVVRFVETVTLVHIDIDAETKKMPIGSCRPAKDDDETGMFGIYYRMVNSDKLNMVKGAPYTFVKTVLKDNKYTIIPGKVDHDFQWTSKMFWLGFAFILAIVVLPQLSSFRDLSHKIRTALRARIRPEEESAFLQLDTEDPQLPSPGKSMSNADMKKIIEELQASNVEMKKDIKALKEKRP